MIQTRIGMKYRGRSPIPVDDRYHRESNDHLITIVKIERRGPESIVNYAVCSCGGSWDWEGDLDEEQCPIADMGRDPCPPNCLCRGAEL